MLVSKGKKLNVLYFSCHEILEYDDLRMLVDAGHNVFSIGSFMDKSSQTMDLRKAKEEFFQKNLFEEFHKTGCSLQFKTVTKEFCKNFDLVIINHFPILFTVNRDAFGDLPVIMRTIGQSTHLIEKEYSQFADRVHIVRYSETERNAPGFSKTDSVIYFGKNPNDYLPWRGGSGGLSFHNGFAARNSISFPDVGTWQRINERTGSRLYGAWNDGILNAGGVVSPEDMGTLMQEASFYLYIYSRPPSYTLSVLEAMMAGLPILAPSAQFVVQQGCAVDDAWFPARYEVPTFLAEGGGATYNTLDEAIELAHTIQNDRTMAERMSKSARATAMSRFDSEKIRQQWADLISSIC
ncbi:hypothetical protein FBZ82_1247 [Azospirillum brasilense]|uniref:Spore protein YkvP/CgeB glycosyl transferase-like domain-containing protein n=1 Tax=Azospirillum brasilense TaxID=192 RepID=A0A560AGJ9_AZOBR|nr:glycosyltransferase family 4 protein [Azospirillum brasilense]TWA59485.1 hypothetical protein FBZ82_1247 [Azospirillum brasilense]